MSTLARSLALCCILPFAACSSDSSNSGDGPSESTPAALARLVPANSTLFVQFASLDALQGFVRGLGVGDEFVLEPADLLSNAGFAGLDAKLVQRDRPLGIALALIEGSIMPEVTAVLPVRDADAFVAGWTPAQPGQSAAGADGYVGLSTAAGYAPNADPTPIAALPTEIISMHADLGALIEAMSPLLEGQMAQVEQMIDSANRDQQQQIGLDMSGITDLYFEFFDSMLNSLESLDLTVKERGSIASLEFDLTMRAGSALAGLADGQQNDLVAAARRIDPEAAISFLAGGDMPRAMELIEPFYGSLLSVYPEPMREGMTRYMENFSSAYGLFGDTFSGDLDFAETGMSYAMHLESSDPAALLAKYLELIGDLDGSGFQLAEGSPRKVDLGAHEATYIRMEVDSEQLAETAGAEVEALGAGFQQLMEMFFGPEGPELYLVPAEKELAVVMTPDEVFLERALSRVGSGGSSVAGFEWAIEHFGQTSPMIAYRLDLARMMGQFSDALGGVAAMPPMPADQSLPTVFAGGFEGRRWRAGLSLDRRDLESFVAAMQNQ